MSPSASSERRSLNIGHGLTVELKGDSVWQVRAKSGCFDLVETQDFYRVLPLLERPYWEAKTLFDDLASDSAAAGGFPLWRVVAAGLGCQSEEWASRALRWLPELSEDERRLLRDLLLIVSGAKWASQKSRQLADRYAKQVRMH